MFSWYYFLIFQQFWSKNVLKTSILYAEYSRFPYENCYIQLFSNLLPLRQFVTYYVLTKSFLHSCLMFLKAWTTLETYTCIFDVFKIWKKLNIAVFIRKSAILSISAILAQYIACLHSGCSKCSKMQAYMFPVSFKLLKISNTNVEKI